MVRRRFPHPPVIPPPFTACTPPAHTRPGNRRDSHHTHCSRISRRRGGEEKSANGSERKAVGDGQAPKTQHVGQRSDGGDAQHKPIAETKRHEPPPCTSKVDAAHDTTAVVKPTDMTTKPRTRAENGPPAGSSRSSSESPPTLGLLNRAAPPQQRRIPEKMMSKPCATQTVHNLDVCTCTCLALPCYSGRLLTKSSPVLLSLRCSTWGATWTSRRGAWRGTATPS